MAAPPIDIKAKTAQRSLIVTWTPDHLSDYGFKYLRCHCACASCVDEHTGRRILDPETVPEQILIEDLSLVGHYAIQFRFSDGHDTGIYSWNHLLNICPCPRCGGLVKQATISFGQPMPEEELARAETEALACDLFLVVGSSLVVYPAAALPGIARNAGARLVIVNREPTDHDPLADLAVQHELGPTLGAAVGVD